ncbi:Major Facilitator Superfamily protein [Roseimaritima multifibrata]|uniref:Major Facilitator Superfamily protein n=1 Tax=Roseimaritima multifibrata TaxID=1930274 RepID=A0A517MI18_9BACT|nr:MFS transporter [Roseimaritima multifibrata]QDS94529.1 Major Facilitator Superfamily protein [Roseimaritima multifibrata]
MKSDSETPELHQRPRFINFPFDPNRLPFFYGTVVLVCGTLGVLASAPGQTVGVSVFTDFLIEAHHLSRSWISFAYFVGTIASAFLITRAGRWYDRFGGRWVSAGSAAMLAVVLTGMSFSVGIADVAASFLPQNYSTYASFVVLTLGFFAMRFFGQGMLTLSSRNMVLEWFEQRRGMALAFIGISVAFGFSITPPFFEWLIQRGGWSWAWQAIAAMVAAFAVIAVCLGRARPEDHNLTPDGPFAKENRKTHAETLSGRQFTLSEARRTYSFWVFTFSVGLSGLVLTAFSFHVVSIFGDGGMQRSQAVAIFVPAACVSVVVEFVGSWFSDFVKLKYLAMVQLVGILTLSLSLSFLQSGPTVYLVVLGMGLMQGMFGIISAATWPRFYGRKHLGAISGFSTSIVVAGTAVGPYLFSLAHDQFGTYRPATLLCAVLAIILLALSPRADRPH